MYREPRDPRMMVIDEIGGRLSCMIFGSIIWPAGAAAVYFSLKYAHGWMLALWGALGAAAALIGLLAVFFWKTRTVVDKARLTIDSFYVREKAAGGEWRILSDLLEVSGFERLKILRRVNAETDCEDYWCVLFCSVPGGAVKRTTLYTNDSLDEVRAFTEAVAGELEVKNVQLEPVFANRYGEEIKIGDAAS